MQIECLIKRKAGSTVRLGAMEYRFGPAPEGHPHVADVENEAHAKHLLSIVPRTFVEFVAENFKLDPRRVKPEPVKADGFLVTAHPTVVVVSLNEGPTELTKVVPMAARHAQMDTKEWNELSDSARYEFVEAFITHVRDGEAAARRAREESEKPPVNDAPTGEEKPLTMAEAKEIVKNEPRDTVPPEDKVSATKAYADMSERELRAWAKKFGIDESMEPAALVTALENMPRA